MDHDWGPRAQLFLTPADNARWRGRVLRALARDLPPIFAGMATRFRPPDADHVRVRAPKGSESGSPNVWVGTIREFFQGYLFFDPARTPTPQDWLLFPSQKLRSIAEGPIYRDDLGLGRNRSRFRYYPRDLWLHLLAVQWFRISEREAFVGRADAVEDRIGAQLLAGRQVREMMRLAFLLERRYAPYDKWFGTAFRQLRLAPGLEPLLHRALLARTPEAREAALSRAYELLARAHNRLGLGGPVAAKVRPFHDRPYLVIHAARFAEATRSRIRDLEVRRFPRLGSVDQFGDTEELGSRKEQLEALRSLVRA